MRVLMFAGVAAAALLSAPQAQAAPYYPWCAWYNWTTYNCGFTSRRQCLAAVSGVGGTCRPNEQRPGRRSELAPRVSGSGSAVPRAGEPARMIQLPNGRWISSYGCYTDEGYGRYGDCGGPDRY